MQHLPDGRGRQSELAGHDQRPRLRVLTCRQDPLLELARQTPRLAPGHRRPVDKRRPASLQVATPESIAGRAACAAGGRGLLRTRASKDQLHDPAARLERVAHPLRRANCITHLGLLGEAGLGRPQASPEARTQSAVSQVCRQQSPLFRTPRIRSGCRPPSAMTSQGSASGRFTRALAQRNLRGAEIAAKEMGGLSQRGMAGMEEDLHRELRDQSAADA